ncbi:MULTISPECIES: metallophosphoesterase family protein [Brevibacterium]|uniref:Metallophosphoesterase n=1 Tax=Brevibacterium casei TaxID=33889 RepID=A0A7T4DHY4_9MICO|nr:MULTISPECIES: metallophosphoesterase [Brevibacterium]QQB12921.1 metallophosphoesterase [Brevibacterium casei]
MSPRRKTSALIVLLAVIAALTLPWAIFSARADLSFGPHEAQYRVTADARLTLDFGPLGSLLVPADEFLPLGLGLSVDVGEIPVSGETADAASALGTDAAGGVAAGGVGGGVVDALGGDIASYASLFSAPQTQIDEVVTGLTRDILIRWALAVCLTTGLLVGVTALLGPTRIAALGRALAGRELIAIGSAVVLVLGGLSALVLTRPAPPQPDPAFAGTPLAGAEVTGRLGGIIDEAFTAVKEFSDENDAFYDAVIAGLHAGWTNRPLSGDWSAAGMVPPASGSADVSTFVLSSDVHCNYGMARVVGDVARLTGADGIIDAGDVTMTGTSAENYCFDVLDDELPQDVPKMFVKGNHDSQETAKHARSRGWAVLDDSTAQLAGVRFLGGPDPRRTVFGSGPELETELTADEYAAKLRDEACRTDFDIMLIHDPRIAQPALESGCAPYAMSGHWHRQVGPEQFGRGVRYVSSTTGGALANALTPGPLKMDAEVSVIRVDTVTKTPIDVQTITVTPGEDVSIGPWVRFPAPLPLVARPVAPAP